MTEEKAPYGSAFRAPGFDVRPTPSRHMRSSSRKLPIAKPVSNQLFAFDHREASRCDLYRPRAGLRSRTNAPPGGGHQDAQLRFWVVRR